MNKDHVLLISLLYITYIFIQDALNELLSYMWRDCCQLVGREYTPDMTGLAVQKVYILNDPLPNSILVTALWF